MGKDRKTRSGSSSAPSSKPIPHVPQPIGTCGFPECLTITAKNACESFPELMVNPSPEPDGRDKEIWKEWWKGYKQWGKVQCACGNGYFCRRHGIWVPGVHVREGKAPSYDRQLEDGCPEFHYHPEVQVEVASSEANPEVDSQKPLSPSRHQETSSKAEKPSSSKSKDSRTKDGKSKDSTTPDKKRRSSGKDPTRSRHYTSPREHKESSKKGKEVDRQSQPSEPPLYEKYHDYSYYQYPDTSAADELDSHSGVPYSYSVYDDDDENAERLPEDKDQNETKHEEYTPEHSHATSSTYGPSSSRGPYFSSGIDERITDLTGELGDTSIDDSWPTSYPGTYDYKYKMTTDPTDTLSGHVRASSSSYPQTPQDTVEAEAEAEADAYYGYVDAEYVPSNTVESHETVYGEEEVPSPEKERGKSKHRSSKSSSKHKSRSKH